MGDPQRCFITGVEAEVSILAGGSRPHHSTPFSSTLPPPLARLTSTVGTFSSSSSSGSRRGRGGSSGMGEQPHSLTSVTPAMASTSIASSGSGSGGRGVGNFKTPPAGHSLRTPSSGFSRSSSGPSRTPGSGRSGRRTPSSVRSSRTPGSVCSSSRTSLVHQDVPPSTIVGKVVLLVFSPFIFICFCLTCEFAFLRLVPFSCCSVLFCLILF